MRSSPLKNIHGTTVWLWGWWVAVVSISVLWQTQLISPSTEVLGAAFILFLLPVFWMEIRQRALSSFLEHVFKTSRRTHLFLFLALLSVVKFYWIPGYRLYTMGDGPPHFLNTWMVYHAIQNGEIPYWTNYWACGAPFLQFYPPLFSYLTAAILALCGDIFLAITIGKKVPNPIQDGTRKGGMGLKAGNYGKRRKAKNHLAQKKSPLHSLAVVVKEP